MAYNEDVAARLRKTLARRKGITERKMFGGLAFLMNGNMCCGVIDMCCGVIDNVLRLGKEGAGPGRRSRSGIHARWISLGRRSRAWCTCGPPVTRPTKICEAGSSARSTSPRRFPRSS